MELCFVLVSNRRLFIAIRKWFLYMYMDRITAVFQALKIEADEPIKIF